MLVTPITAAVVNPVAARAEPVVLQDSALPCAQPFVVALF